MNPANLTFSVAMWWPSEDPAVPTDTTFRNGPGEYLPEEGYFLGRYFEMWADDEVFLGPMPDALEIGAEMHGSIRTQGGSVRGLDLYGVPEGE